MMLEGDDESVPYQVSYGFHAVFYTSTIIINLVFELTQKYGKSR